MEDAIRDPYAAISELAGLCRIAITPEEAAEVAHRARAGV